MKSLLFGAALLAGVAPVLAKDADPSFLPPSALYDPASFLPPPPPNGSPRALAELAELKRYQATSTPEQRAEAKSDNENGTIFGVALGPTWDLTKLPATAKVIDNIVASEGDYSDIAKKEFHRSRPWVDDTSIQTCAPHKSSQDNASYPSGHATVAYGVGIVLARLMPSHADAILARSARFAENRLVCGFHFRSDIVAGQQFGTIMALRLMANPQFAGEMAAAKTELIKAYLAP